MRRERWLWVASLPVMAACAQIIGADFEDLKPRSSSTTTNGSAGSGEAGTGGEGGTSAAGAAGWENAGGSGTNSSGGSANDASPDVSSGGSAGTLPEGGSAGRDPDAGDPTIVINEILGNGTYDWIELYNAGSAPFDLRGHAIAQASGSVGAPEATSWLIFPQDAFMVVNPGGFLLILCKQGAQGGPVDGCQGIVSRCMEVTWTISSTSGEIVYLLGPDNGQARPIIDQVYYPEVGFEAGAPMTGQTYGRIPDGTGAFTLTKPTADLPNELP